MKLIAEFEKTLTPVDTKTNIVFPFEINEAFDKLVFTCSYNPKRLEDNEKALIYIKENVIRDSGTKEDLENLERFLPLKNLLTLSIDDPKGYRGCAHRQAEAMCHILSENFASVGFIEGEISKGSWAAVINVHAVVTESCNLTLKIEGGDENDR